MSPIHMDVTPACLVAPFQNRPKTTGANNPDTNMAVPVTHKFTNCGIYKASNKANKETKITERWLYFNSVTSSAFFNLGLIISLIMEEEPAIKKESAVEITVAIRTIIMITTIGKLST